MQPFKYPYEKKIKKQCAESPVLFSMKKINKYVRTELYIYENSLSVCSLLAHDLLMNKCLLQNGSGWKGTLVVIHPMLSAQGGTTKADCRGQCPGGF